MEAEIIAVGTELLVGQIVNTNAQYLSQQLTFLGVDVCHQVVVGDDRKRLRHAIEVAQSRSNLIFFTGGLGPTMDDITKDVLAEVLGRGLDDDQMTWVQIEHMLDKQGTSMLERNKRQAHVITGSDVLSNPVGLAIGNALINEGVAYIVLPGPPAEMKAMFAKQVIPWLEEHGCLERTQWYTSLLKFAGIGESKIEDALYDLITTQGELQIATYAKEGEVLVRLATKHNDAPFASSRLGKIETEIRQRIGQHLFAVEDIPLSKVLVHRFVHKHMTLSVAESCTGGLFANMITSVPGSSEMFLGGVVAYSNQMKQQILGVPHELLEGEAAPGAVSAETVKAMVEGMQHKVDTDFTVAITGVAGPNCADCKPAGLVYIAFGQKGKGIAVEELRLHGDRDMIRMKTVNIVMYRLWTKLK